MRQLLSLSLAVCMAGATALAIADDAPKYTTKQVMKTAMKGGLLKKVAAGDASAEEKEQLHAMLVALASNTPKKGGEDSWKEKTGKLVAASKEGDAAALKAAANCAACHKVHK